jgi:hypothetical protein
MNLHPIDRHETGIAVTGRGTLVRHARANRQVEIALPGERQRLTLASVRGPVIEEAIARFVEANPPQLYRSGA